MSNYDIENLIGEGAYGIVLKARRRQTGQAVAIKKFKETDNDQLIKKTTVRQIKVLRSLRHKNIVELQQVFKKKGLVHLVFQYLDNNLLQVLQKHPQGLPNKLIARYLYQVLEGLSYMHSLNYIHRDIKPQNLLVGSDGCVKICDMGFAKYISNQMTDYVATRWYRPPELLVGHSYGPPIDIWALGCIMAQLSDTQPLFPGNDEIDQLHLIMSSFGSMPDILLKSLEMNPILKDFKIPKRNKTDILFKYKTKLTERGVNLLRKMLETDPQKRITAAQAMKHPYFDHIRPRKDRLQKTSQLWFSKSSQKTSIQSVSDCQHKGLYTTRHTQNQKPNKPNKLNINKQSSTLSKQIFKFGKKNWNSENSQEGSSLFQMGINKIYKKKQKQKSHYMTEIGQKKREEDKACQLIHSNKTNYHFGLNVKKKDKPVYLINI